MDNPQIKSINPAASGKTDVLMLLTNAFNPDPRVHQEASALIQKGYNVKILCWDRDIKETAFEIIDGVKVERIYIRSTHGRGTTQILFLLLFWLKGYSSGLAYNFDIVHCHDFDTLPLGYALAKSKDAKLVYDAHESYIDMLGNLPAWLRKTIYTLENFFLGKIDLLITVGEILRRSLAKRGAENTCVVGNWKDPDRFKFPKNIIEQEKKRLKISGSQLVVSFIANLGEERQVPQLIKAIQSSPDLFLIIGGNGSCRAMVEDAARKHSNICYLGFVNPDQIPLYTAISDIVFYGFDPLNKNARYSAPNKLFEALAAGKAVITGDFGEIGRIVKKWECGIILKTYSGGEIKRELDKLNPENLEKYQLNSKKAGCVYNWQRAEESLLKAYRCIKDAQENGIKNG